MCFKNLPIEFDAEGNAKLKEGLEDPWALRPGSAPARKPGLYSGALSPSARRAVMHAAGAHAFGLLVHDGRADSKGL